MNRTIISWAWEGMGNRMWSDTIAFTFALMLNTSMAVRMTGDRPRNPYNYVTGIRYTDEIPDFPDWTHVQLFRSHALPRVTFSTLQKHKGQALVSRFTHPAFSYLQPLFGWDLYRIFDDYAFYFLSNFLVRFPDRLFEIVMAHVSKIPSTIKLYGFHMRWNMDSDMFIGTVKKGLKLVRGLVRSLVRKRYLLAIASDSGPLVKGFIRMAGKNHIVPRINYTDPGDRRVAGLIDMILIMYCRKHVLTLRSTFSSVIAMKTARNPLWVCNFMDHLFMYSGSQVVWQTIAYQDGDYFCPNRYFKVRGDVERFIRFHFVHFGV